MAANKKFVCEICNVSTSDQISYDNHLLGSKHQLTLHLKHVRAKKEKCGIYITGFASSKTTKDDLCQLFSQHGKIVNIYPDNVDKYAIIEFSNEGVVEKLLKSDFYLHGQKLFINRRIVKPPDTVKQSQTELDIFSEIIAHICTYPNFKIQSAKLIEQVQLPFQSTINIYNQLCSDIQRCLNTRFVNCRVWPFGSTVSGLGFKNSDVDVYIEVVYHPKLQDSEEMNLSSAYVKIAKNILSKTNLFTHVIAIPKAKTPIVKCKHKSTGVSCDINFKNMLGVCNSKLINFLLNLNPKLRPLMIIIKLWGKIQELTGSGKFSNYGLTMMLIFYLQQHPDHILPPVGWLQTPQTVQFHEGWNGGFCDDLRFLPNIKSNNKSSVQELLYGFFKFYSKYDFGFNVICPLIGENLAKTDFTTPEKLPDKLFHYKNMLSKVLPLKYNTPICIQDPFELSHNITGSVSNKQLEDFQKLCHIATDVCEKNLRHNKDLLKKLLNKQLISNAKFATDEKCIFKMQVNASLKYLEKNIDESIEDKPKILRQMWFENVNQFLISALSKLFLFEMTVQKDTQISKSQKLEKQSDIHDNNIIDTISFHCVGYNNVWDTRKTIAKNFKLVEINENKFLDREIAITDYIVNVLCKGIKISDPVVDFNLTFNSRINPTEAEFVLENTNSRKNCFRHMANFFVSKLPIWFDKFVKEKNAPVTNEKEENKQNNEIKSETTESTIDSKNIKIENVKLEDNSDKTTVD